MISSDVNDVHDRHHHRAQKSLLHGERTQREEKERNASSPPRVIYTPRVKEEQRENKSQRFPQGKFVFCATQREKRNARILKLLRSTRLIKRTLAFGTFVETNDDSFSSSFSSRIFVSLAIFMYVFSTLTNLAQKKREKSRGLA